MTRFWFVVFLFLVAVPVLAQKPNPKTSFLDAESAGPDFARQGEYVGVVRWPDLRQSTGLQIVALGDGKFQAVLLAGGLPGAGWNKQDRIELTGEVTEGVATLSADGWQVQQSDQQATVLDAQGKNLGKLTRVERRSPTLGAAAPRGAHVLFDGTEPELLESGRVSPDGLLMVGTTTKMPVRDFHMHLEFRTPFMPYARSQARGNSGVYIQRRYEVQILDSFGLKGVANECGGLYRQTPPDVNMALPPLSWQTYDITFRAARFDEEGTKTAPARITVLHNGVAIHDDRVIKSKTGAGAKEAANDMPIHLQNHGDPVFFRNVWLVEMEEQVVEQPTRRRLLRRRRCGPLCRLLRRR